MSLLSPLAIGSNQDPSTGSVRPVFFLPGQYIIEGLSSGFMFLVGGLVIVMMDLALDKNLSRSVKVFFATAGICSVAFTYVMSILFIRMKIPTYLSGSLL